MFLTYSQRHKVGITPLTSMEERWVSELDCFKTMHSTTMVFSGLSRRDIVLYHALIIVLSNYSVTLLCIFLKSAIVLPYIFNEIGFQQYIPRHLVVYSLIAKRSTITTNKLAPHE